MTGHDPDGAGDQRSGLTVAAHRVLDKLDASRAAWAARPAADLWGDLALMLDAGGENRAVVDSARVHAAALLIYLIEGGA